MTEKRNFFLSYAGADRAWAEWIAWQLESADYTVFLQAWDFDVGQNFIERMHDALEQADYTIALLSAAYLASPYCRDEWTGAFSRDADGRTRLLGIRIEACELPRLLRTRVFVDLVGMSREQARARLLDAIRLGRRKPADEPNFPSAALSAPIVTGVPQSARAIGSADVPRFPGSGPRITNLPPRNPVFCGRSGYLRQVHRLLASESTAAVVQSATVHGLGGVGKTQLAIEYAYRYGNEYDIIWWIPAELPVAIPETLAILARKLGLPERSSQFEVLDALWDELRERDRWLLIYDNAEDARPLAAYRPPRGEGQVLITSRTPSWGTTSKVELGVLKQDEALNFLRKRIGDRDKESLAALSATLGSLPLALEQAASYLDETRATPAEYLQMFHEHGPELLAVETATTEQTVATTWRVALDQVRMQAPAAQDLLILCAFLHPDGIPKSLFTEHSDGLPEELRAPFARGFAFNQVLATIHRYSLMQVSSDSMSIHRLVQAVIRSSLTQDEARASAARVVVLVDSAFPSGGSDTALWDQCGLLLPHALAAIDNAEAVGAESLISALLLNKVASFLWGRADHSQAKRLLEQALALERGRQGDDLAIADRLNDLGLVLWDMGRLDEAKSALEQTLEVRQSALGRDHPEVAATLNNLGAVLCDLEIGAEARDALNEAIGIWMADHKSGTPAIALALSNLGVALMIMDKLEHAKEVLERSLRLWDELSTSAETEVRELGHLAGERAYCERELHEAPRSAPRAVAMVPASGRLGDVAATRDQAIEWARTTGQHAAVATTLDNLGTVLARSGELPEALQLLFRGLGIRQLQLGNEHPDVAWSVNNIAVVVADMGELVEAKALFTEALAIRETKLGLDHPDVATSLNNLATALADLGDWPGAQQLLERALRIREEGLGEAHPAVARVRARLATAESAAHRKE